MAQKVFFHVDLDAFFASVEIKDNPSLKGKPVIIAEEGPRCVVSTCSYEARAFKVHSAMPSVQARRLCPDGIFISPRHKRYSEVSRQVMAILSDYGVVNQVSIDEAWLDMSGTERLFGKPKDIALAMKKRVRDEIGITMSVGIASSPFIAKMASDYNKPDGLCLVSPSRNLMFIDAIGLENIQGIGKSSLKALNDRGFRTPSDVRQVPEDVLIRMFGSSMGSYLHKACNAVDPWDYTGEIKNHSISTETTFLNDVSDGQTLRQVLMGMSHELFNRSIEQSVMARTIGLKLRFSDFHTITVQSSSDGFVLNVDCIFENAVRLLSIKWSEGVPIRLIGLGLYQTYSGDSPIQDSLFSEAEHRKRKLDKAVHGLSVKGVKLRKASEL